MTLKMANGWTPKVIDIVKPTSLILNLLLGLSSCAGMQAIGQSATSSDEKCELTPLKRSQAMIERILSDLSENHTQVGGGGITDIQLTATNTYVVSIAQEERIDQIRYHLSVEEPCDVKILNREISAISPGSH